MRGRSSWPAAIATKPLLSIEETAMLLGESRATLYRAVNAGTLPLPVWRIGKRLRVPRRAVERLLDGLDPMEPTPPGDHDIDGPSSRTAPSSVTSRRRPTCSAARRSSSGTPSV
jgi:excisionase family DNA binding protein